MSDLPYLPLWVAKYNARTGHLSLEEDGAYMRLLRLSWVSPHCQVPVDDRWVQRMMRVDEATYRRVVVPILDEFFYQAEGAWRNSTLRRCYEANTRKNLAKIEAGKKGGAKSALKRQEKRSSSATDLLGANGKQNPTSHSHSHSHKEKALELRASLIIRIRKAMGPGLTAKGRSITDETIRDIALEWLEIGATEDEIVDVVQRQTEQMRSKPLRYLKTLTADIEGVVANRQPPPIDPHPEPLKRPPGKAGECLEAIIAAYGETQAAAWLREAEWIEGAVILPTDFLRDQVAKRFGGFLGRSGFVAASPASLGQHALVAAPQAEATATHG